MGFFDAGPQGAAVLKHGILRSYLPTFTTIVGKLAPEHRVFYLDGYAGRGAYEDGTPGSPALAADTARHLVANRRQLTCLYVERERTEFLRLASLLQSVDHDHREYLGTVERHLPEILRLTEGHPLFAFFDPYGMCLPFDRLRSVLERARRYPGVSGRCPTEVLINFSVPGVRRNAGHLLSESTDPTYAKARAKIIERMDAFLGGDWWREVWQAAGNDGEGVERVLDGFLDRIAMLPGNWVGWRVPVSDRWEGPLDYHLVFLTQHRDGLWLFNNSVSTAMEKYFDFCHRDQLSLNPIESRALAWIDRIEGNISSLVGRGQPFVLGDRVFEIYEGVAGHARETHVRAALERLHAQGAIATTPKGVKRLQRMKVLPASPSQRAAG